MKNNKILPSIVLSISVSILIFNIGFLLFNVLKVGSHYIWSIIVFIALSFIQICFLGRGGKRIAEVAARFSLDALQGKQMAIETELSLGVINEQEAKEKNKILYQEIKLFESLDEIMKIFVKIPIIIFLLNFIVIIIFIINKIINIELIEESSFIGIVQCGIISQLLLIVINTFIGTIIAKYIK